VHALYENGTILGLLRTQFTKYQCYEHYIGLEIRKNGEETQKEKERESQYGTHEEKQKSL
jgi:hypothetical protein